jgi:non-ribosomal peptide synthetase-like protein
MAVLVGNPKVTIGGAHLAPEPRTLPDIFLLTVQEHGARLAVDAPDGTLTYAELHCRCVALAQTLSAAGIGPGDRVGVRLASGSSDLYAAILGVLMAGAAYVPVDADDPDVRVQMIWDECAVAAVVGEELELSIHSGGQGNRRPVSADDDAWVIFTSGSTGRPKGVAVTHRAAAAFVDAEERFLKVEPDDRVLAGLSVGFDASCEEMWLAWRNGAALVPAPRTLVRSGSELGPWLLSRQVTVVSTVPTLAGMWHTADLANVRLLILGGEACPDELGWRLARDREVWNTYGPTEATVVATAAPIVEGLPITIGQPLDGWEVAVMSDDGQPTPEGCVGELCIRGVGLGRYLNPELDAERFVGVAALGWTRAYRSGDFVRLSPSGLEFVGRQDDQVKLGGRRIELGEIQTALQAVPGVRSAVATMQENDAGDHVLVGYVVSDLPTATIRAHLVQELPESLLPVVVRIAALPLSASGKLDRNALPWPPIDDGSCQDTLNETERWLADRWASYLGVRPSSSEDDFFELGGSSLAAAKLASDLRTRFAAAAVSDIYTHRTLGELAQRMDALLPPPQPNVATAGPRPRGGFLQMGGVGAFLVLGVPTWMFAEYLYNYFFAAPGQAPQLAWVWMVALWLAFVSLPGRFVLVALARRLLLHDLAPGRYQRRSSLGARVWFVARLADLLHMEHHGGTPWARTVARVIGAKVGPGARLGTIPSSAGLVRIGPGATLEVDVDVSGWWIDGSELIVGKVDIGAGARIGTRALLMPGVTIGAGAEVEPGSVVTCDVPPGERWAGTPAHVVGRAGEHWPADESPPIARARLWRLAYAGGLTFMSLMSLVSLAPGLLIFWALGVDFTNVRSAGIALLVGAPLLALIFTLTDGLIAALVVRWLGRYLRPGWHSDGRTLWAAWMSGELLGGTRKALFPLYSSLYTRPWLRIMGIKVGRRSEVSTAIGLSPLVTLGHTDFLADDVVFNTGRSRGGWLHLAPITLDEGVFLGNGALIDGPRHFGRGSLLGVQSMPLRDCPSDTTWFGTPALEFPRVAAPLDPARTVSPGPRLVAGRAVVDFLRIVLPQAASIAIGVAVFTGVNLLGQRLGGVAMVALIAPVLLLAGVVAIALTAASKWTIMGRYRSGDHPLWSGFVWRDEVLNSCQEVIGAPWMLDFILGTPLMNVYLRIMGSQVGRDVWCDTLTITEFDMVTLDEGCSINRRSCIESHLFHDRVMSIGPIHLGAGATVGPSSAILPDTVIGEGCCVGGRSVVLRGEELPPHTRWHGAPVVAM